MTVEQLEALAGGANPAFMGLDYDEVITALARRVLAAEKLVEAAEKLAELDEATRAFDAAMDKLADAATAYSEASK